MAKETQLRVNFTGVDKTAGAVKSIQGRISGMTKMIGGAIAGGLLVRGLARFGAESVRMAQQQEAAEKKLSAVLRATEGAAGRTFAQLKRAAGELQSMTNFGDEVVMSGQAILATFKNIKGDQFDEATKAVMDMAAVMDTDLKSVAIQVGKALNDPIAGISALGRAGVQFSEDQKKAIQSAMALGDTMGAQKIILAELKGEFGGAAVAMADPLKQVVNVWNDVRERIGLTILELLQFSAAFESVDAGLVSLAGKFDNLSISIFGMVQGLLSTLSGIKAFFEMIGEAAGRLVNAFETLNFDDIFGGMESFDDRMTKIMDKQTKAIDDFAKKKSDSDIAKQLAKIGDKADVAADKITKLKGLMGKMTLSSSYAAAQMQYGGVEPVVGNVNIAAGGGGGMGGQQRQSDVFMRAILSVMKQVADNTSSLNELDGTV